jgi:4-hydroxy 2-oxovalerate aldolase
VPYAEIVASISSKSAGPGTRANIDEFTETTSEALEVVGGAKKGKAIIILNPVEPPLMMRNTVFCAIPEEAAEAGELNDKVRESIAAMVERVQEYVPGYHLRAEPQFDHARDLWNGMARVTVPIEVKGRGDYLPDYAGNLDIITAAAARVGDMMVAHRLGVDSGWVAADVSTDLRRHHFDHPGGLGMSTEMTHPIPEFSGGVDVRLTDTTLRDGSHAMSHQFTEEQVRTTVRALDQAGVQVIEVTHGDGLGGSSFNYGFSAVDEMSLIKAAKAEAEQAKIAVLLLPGLGRVHDLQQARDNGADIARIATHCTEADVSIQHFGAARELGMETVGFLMLSHMISPEALAKQARIMVDAGCQCVYVVDSAGALILEDVSDRVEALVSEIGKHAQVGYHGHQNMSFGVANSVLAYRAGAKQIDGSLCALGAGAGNSPTEVLAVAFERLGIKTGVDLNGVMGAAQDVVRPYIRRLPWMDRSSITQGYAGVYSSFLIHAERAAERYDVPAHEILQKVGEYGYVGGQEDMIIDVALELQKARELDMGDLAALGAGA